VPAPAVLQEPWELEDEPLVMLVAVLKMEMISFGTYIRVNGGAVVLDGTVLGTSWELVAVLYSPCPVPRR
jgi:hypothetical protein